MQIGVGESDSGRINIIILNLALLGWFVIEMSVSAYVIYLVVKGR